MKIGINSLYQIKQIREITDTALTVIELDELAETYPFEGYSDTKILCYCYKNDNGISAYPYIDTNLIERLEAGTQENQLLSMKIDENQGAIDFILMNF